MDRGKACQYICGQAKASKKTDLSAARVCLPISLQPDGFWFSGFESDAAMRISCCIVFLFCCSRTASGFKFKSTVDCSRTDIAYAARAVLPAFKENGQDVWEKDFNVPKLFHYYNKHVGEVDRFNALVALYTS